MTEIAPERLTDIRDRHAAATEGPWEWVGPDLEHDGGAVICVSVDCARYCYGGSPRVEMSDADKEFLEHAHTDMAAVLAEIDRLTRALREIVKDRNTWARQLADAKDDRDTAAAERDQERTRRAETGNERDALYAVLRELVELKDGPRDDDYERRKPAAWTWARRVLSNWEAV